MFPLFKQTRQTFIMFKSYLLFVVRLTMPNGSMPTDIMRFGVAPPILNPALMISNGKSVTKLS